MHACEPDMRHHKDRRDWYAGHPKSLWIREDDLLDLVYEFFAERVFGARQPRNASATRDSVDGRPCGHLTKFGSPACASARWRTAASWPASRRRAGNRGRSQAQDLP